MPATTRSWPGRPARRSSTSPSATPSVHQPKEGRVRQHVVGRGLLRGGDRPCRTGLGYARADAYRPGQFTHDGWPREPDMPGAHGCHHVGPVLGSHLRSHSRTWLSVTARRSPFRDFLTVRDGDKVQYRPTVHYAYLPADAALASWHECRMEGYPPPRRPRIMGDDITSGIDELGVLLLGHDLNGWWTGSQLGIEEARQLVPHQNATTLQVAASVLGAVAWMLGRSRRGPLHSRGSRPRASTVGRAPLPRALSLTADQLEPADGSLGSVWQVSNPAAT